MAITGETRIVDLPEKSSLVEGDFFVVDNENGATSKIPAAAVSGSATAGLVAEEYSNASTYAVGEYCIHVESGIPKLYRCTTAITTAESWNSAHWSLTDAGSELTTANADIETLNSNLSTMFLTKTLTNATLSNNSAANLGIEVNDYIIVGITCSLDGYCCVPIDVSGNYYARVFRVDANGLTTAGGQQTTINVVYKAR